MQIWSRNTLDATPVSLPPRTRFPDERNVRGNFRGERKALISFHILTVHFPDERNFGHARFRFARARIFLSGRVKPRP